jgi:hypothetical protein
MHLRRHPTPDLDKAGPAVDTMEGITPVRGNYLKTPGLSASGLCGSWRKSSTSMQQRLVKTGERLVKHARYYWLVLAESHLKRRLSGAMLRQIWALPVPAGLTCGELNEEHPGRKTGIRANRGIRLTMPVQD